MTKKIYKNKNGNLEIRDFVKLIYKGELDGWTRKHQLSKNSCPPYELIDDTIACFYCVDCIKQCKDRVKEHKTYYQVGKIKITKEELDE